MTEAEKARFARATIDDLLYADDIRRQGDVEFADLIVTLRREQMRRMLDKADA